MTEEELKLENRKLDIQLQIHQENQRFERRRIEIEEHKRVYHNPVFIALCKRRFVFQRIDGKNDLAYHAD
ncbi:hypothetical protein RN22_20705 [Grimontia sp. AD028]|uniref:hypothetical protein n=1 Tax=Grimontia sp. AD028 TaxID=1581149 RepID=UPI00061AA77E|nr:hypothetical protein [Grimontia sp. AD028]KKD58537.1 hypothetical protein RN22_20705 [Grimontia sp. AD028]